MELFPDTLLRLLITLLLLSSIVRVQAALVKKNTRLNFLVALFSLFSPVVSYACSDLSGIYQVLDEDPSSAESRLLNLLDECSENSEFFALLGAAQLATGKLFESLENLELSLLIDPDNGVALVDYAEILFLQGEVLSALELNTELLSRVDLPEGLFGQLSARQRRWSRVRVQSNLALAGSVGYDHNLNSAPVSDQIALTLSGNLVKLDVSPEFKNQEGAYTRLFAGATYNRAGQSLSTRISGQIRGRFSSDSRHELIQASTQATLTQTRDTPTWDAVVGFGHLVYGGNAIFSSSTVMARYLFRPNSTCLLYPRAAVQYQHFHLQRSLTGIESSLGLGADCNLRVGKSVNRVGIELSALVNDGVEAERLGKDREGWRLNIVWAKRVGAGNILAQYIRTELQDHEGYSPLFGNGERREESLDSVFFQYIQPLEYFGQTAQFFTNVSYHSQDSTIDLFKTRGFSTEFGVNWSF